MRNRKSFINVLLNESQFQSFVEFNLDDPVANNLCLFLETTESLLDNIKGYNVRSLTKFLSDSVEKNSGFFPEIAQAQIQKICLTYLVVGAPFRLDLDDGKLLRVTINAAITPIEISLFDDLLQTVLLRLYNTVYQEFAKTMPVLPAIRIPLAVRRGYPSPEDATRNSFIDDSDSVPLAYLKDFLNGCEPVSPTDDISEGNVTMVDTFDFITLYSPRLKGKAKWWKWSK